MNSLSQLPSFVSSSPITIKKTRTVEAAVNLIQQTEIGCLLVVDDEDRLVGVLTGKDLVLKVLARKRDASTTLVEEIMTVSPTSLRVDRVIDLVEVSKALSRSHVRRLPIVDSEKRPVGIVSLEDIIVEVGEIVGCLKTAISSDITVGRMRSSKMFAGTKIGSV